MEMGRNNPNKWISLKRTATLISVFFSSPESRRSKYCGYSTEDYLAHQLQGKKMLCPKMELWRRLSGIEKPLWNAYITGPEFIACI